MGQSITLQQPEAVGWMRRALLVMSVLILGVLAARYALDFWSTLRSESVIIDFEAYWTAAKAMTVGENPYTYHLQGDHFIYPYRYPPAFAMALMPLANLPGATAQAIWMIVDQVLFVVAVLASIQIVGARLKWWQWVLVGIAVFGFYAIYANLNLGQVGAMLFASVALAFWFWQRGRTIPAALCVAIGGILKLLPLGLVVYFFWKKQYRLVVFTLVFFAILMVLPDVLLQRPLLAQYIESFNAFGGTEQPFYVGNQALYGFFSRLLGVGLLPQLIALAVGGLMLVALIVVTPRNRGANNPLAVLEYSGLLILLPLVNPMSWTHYFVWLIIAAPALIYLLSEEVRNARQPWRMLIPIGLLLVAFVLLSQPYRIPRFLGYDVEDQTATFDALGVFLQSLFLYGLLMVWGVCVWLVGKNRSLEGEKIEPQLDAQKRASTL
jgi:hypothetical protein